MRFDFIRAWYITTWGGRQIKEKEWRHKPYIEGSKTDGFCFTKNQGEV